MLRQKYQKLSIEEVFREQLVPCKSPLIVVVNGIYDSNQELRFHSEQIPPAGVAYTCGEYVTGHRVNSKELVSYVPVQWYNR